jgi:hypothetical protein
MARLPLPRNALYAPDQVLPDPSNPLAGNMTLADAADWHRQNLADTWQAIQNPQTWMDAASQYRNALLMGTTAPGARNFLAYHASPYSFDRFSSDKIGAGEGAQAFGHGLYVADAERVMNNYFDAFDQQARQTHTRLGDQWLEPLKGQPLDQVAPEQFLMHAHQAFGDIGKTPTQRMRNAEFVLDAKYPNAPDAYREAVRKAAAAVKPADFTTQNAVRYEVNVASDPAHFLDWDTPRDQLAPNVQAFAKVNTPQAWENAADGASLYHGMAKELGSAAAASDAMAKAGIPGIRYLDGSSRAGGEGTRNTVIFDDKLITILRKYGIAGLMAGGGAAAGGQMLPDPSNPLAGN